MTIIVNMLKGVAVGLANIIPGVSGGTMLLILGIYQRVIKALRNIDGATIKGIFSGKQGFVDSMKRLDALFVGSLVVGALLAVVTVAKLMVLLLNQHHDPTFGFFFGLVLVSVVVPYKMINKKSASGLLACVLAIASVIGLTVAMSGEDRLASARQKIAIKAEAAKAKAEGRAVDLPQAGVSARKMGVFALAGGIAVAAMILPGISGSFMLLLMGIYFELLGAITTHNWTLLGVFALGCVVGLLVFTRLLNWLLEHHHDLTLSFLLGLVVGSLWAIWPFKTFAMAGATRVDLHNALPSAFGKNELFTLSALVAGCVVVGLFIWLEGRHEKPDKDAI